MTNVDFLLSLSPADLRALADDAAERLEGERLQIERMKAIRWAACILWAHILVEDGITERIALAFNRARKDFLAI